MSFLLLSIQSHVTNCSLSVPFMNFMNAFLQLPACFLSFFILAFICTLVLSPFFTLRSLNVYKADSYFLVLYFFEVNFFFTDGSTVVANV